MKISKIMCLIIAVVSLSACVPTKTVTRTNIIDSELGCAAIAIRIGEIRGARDYATANKGVTGTNVLAALFFWPVLLVNNSNTTDMINAANEREVTLTGLYKRKKCSSTIPEYGVKVMAEKLKSGNTLEEFN